MEEVERICNPSECTGCFACYNACNHSAIIFQMDNEGFRRPTINKEKCVGCKRCITVCPVNSPSKRNGVPLNVYSGWCRNDEIRISSSSGGAFTELASFFIREMKGVVFGVTLTNNLEARHILVNKVSDLHLIQGSKYIQSNVGDSYSIVKKRLREGQNVLFSGTPCQIAGLKNYLGQDYPNLFTVDLICHGVPSERVFHDYINYLETRIGHVVYEVKFRCKKRSWIFFNMAVNGHIDKNGRKVYDYEGGYYSDPFIRAFLRDNILRPSCYACNYTSTQRLADFTMADWWGYVQSSKVDKDFEKKGVSLILCNTEKSCKLIEKLNLVLKPRNLESAKRTNLSLCKPFAEPASRKTFWQDYDKLSFGEIIKKYMAPERLTPTLYVRYKLSSGFFRRLLLFVCRKYEEICLKLHFPVIKIKI